MKRSTITILGRIISVVLAFFAFGMQTSPEQITSNVSGWFSFLAFQPVSVPIWLANFLSSWRDFVGGAALSAAVFFWFGSFILYPPRGGQIPPTFVSLFGRYVLGQVNVYEIDERGNPVGQTINLTAERDKLVRVEAVVPWLVYRVVPRSKKKLMIVLVKRFPRDEQCTVHFGVLG